VTWLFKHNQRSITTSELLYTSPINKTLRFVDLHTLSTFGSVCMKIVYFLTFLVINISVGFIALSF